MMRALALRLEGPMQSWGGPVAGNDRPSLDLPTKSGVLGLVASALGIDRADVAHLAELHANLDLAVRADRPGSPGVDYQTVLDVPTAEGKVRKHAVISKRRYLYDASFAALLVERKSPCVSLEQIRDALLRPRFAPYLGRRPCPPSVPIVGRDAQPIVGEDWHTLMSQVPVAEHAGAPRYDVHLDAKLAPAADQRPRRQRDVLIGRLPRLFGQRVVHVTTWAPEAASDTGPHPEDTIDPWLPRAQ